MDKKRHDRELLAKLAEHPGYKVLQEYIARKQQEYYLNLATQLAHQVKPLDQRTIDYKRGYWHAATVLLNHPVKVLETLAAELEGEDD
jgi:hypothetical protein